LRPALLVLALVVAGFGCKNRKNTSGELVPPAGADAWESRYAVAFDDDYTRHKLNLTGRAPNDVLDQRLFQSRMGHANFVALVRVEQVWGKGRHESRQDQFLDVELGETLMGEVGKGGQERQLIRLRSEDELPGSLRNDVMILFLRWAPGDNPPYHHHLMPADPDTLELIQAMVRHAQDEGVLNKGGTENVRGRGQRKRRERKEKREAKKAAKAEKKAGKGKASGKASVGAGTGTSEDK
jgi:hypothetical protein